jgi:hypothetical protein
MISVLGPPMRKNLVQIAPILIAGALFGILSAATAAFLIPTREPEPSPWVCVGQLAELPEDGTPRQVAVQLPQRDAWHALPDRRLGVVFLRRLPGGRVVALRAEHHGSFRIPVLYDPQKQSFRSKCWAIRFNLEGREIPEDGVLSGDTMEAIPVRVRNEALYVRYDPPGENPAKTRPGE